MNFDPRKNFNCRNQIPGHVIFSFVFPLIMSICQILTILSLWFLGKFVIKSLQEFPFK
jgi:hypothetical protein